MAAYVARLSGDDWQAWANQILSCHYGPADYQTIPDKDRGDAGLEGFCPSKGHAYQAYGCEEPVSVQERYEKQRGKMTTDIGKFIANAPILSKLLAPTKIRRWILFVPQFDSKEIVAHASKKTAEVLAANLPYVADDFRVMVCQEDEFAIERDKLISASTKGLQIKSAAITAADLAQWTSTNDVLLEALERKVARLPTLTSDAQRATFVQQVLTWYLDGQAVLDRLRGYPQVYEKVVATKSHREAFLAMTAMQGGKSNEILMATLKELRDTLEREAKELHNFSAEQLAYEAVADWLIRCPLDFPEVASV
ncbi:hypothetical protein AACH06_02660 [Ideonella sp. DXS29W]|uniref:Uncharacterized protein n=1 Tax=Ideonella lacteola TaxID=2984193 RepID=A0ABU9BIC5_9BURK